MNIGRPSWLAVNSRRVRPAPGLVSGPPAPLARRRRARIAACRQGRAPVHAGGWRSQARAAAAARAVSGRVVAAPAAPAAVVGGGRATPGPARAALARPAWPALGQCVEEAACRRHRAGRRTGSRTAGDCGRSAYRRERRGDGLRPDTRVDLLQVGGGNSSATTRSIVPSSLRYCASPNRTHCCAR